jgi:antitoxin component YwqK of YwqJK toxin-antitoxin module
MNGFNDKGLKKGPWEAYHSNGKFVLKENYINGKRHGLYESYNPNGELYIKQYYL